MLKDWPTDAPPPSTMTTPRLSPHRFMGLGTFLVGRLHQMRSAKGYLVAQPS